MLATVFLSAVAVSCPPSQGSSYSRPYHSTPTYSAPSTTYYPPAPVNALPTNQPVYAPVQPQYAPAYVQPQYQQTVQQPQYSQRPANSFGGSGGGLPSIADPSRLGGGTMAKYDRSTGRTTYYNQQGRAVGMSPRRN